MDEPIVRLGVVGCGAVTQICHLPAARRTREVKIVALADKNIDRARSLGRRFGIDLCVEDYHEFAGTIDGMIVALPNALHAPVASELLNMKIPVLVASGSRWLCRGRGTLRCNGHLSYVSSLESQEG